MFAVATPDGYRVMPGGLARVAGDADERVIAMQRGGRSKDTWVLSDRPVNAAFTLLTRTVQPQHLVSPTANLPSRAAENLFWFGRYGERAEVAARLLRVAIAGVLDEQAETADTQSPAVVLARQLGLVEGHEDIGLQLLRAATHPDEGLSQRLRQLSRVAFNLRDRMSADNWRSLNQLVGDPVFQRGLQSSMGLPLALVWLDRAVTAMMTLSGFVLDGMTRGLGWRFLSLGRRIERLSSLCTVLQVAIGEEGRTHGLDWLLELTDSTVTYRSRYLVRPEWLPVLDLLLRDEANPRSIGFQVKGLSEYIAKLEMRHGRVASDVLNPGLIALRGIDVRELHPESQALADLLEQLQRSARAVSDELTLKFFSHAASRSVLSLVA
ncbi:circularly permuted type 2 ATP-grasp protein [Piscinibacter sakaiensis]|uniref:alpha-E domain-containing protein n=1 Tax=Piscinibacter sakaiensis TaxID=1547922 RepID=UPI0037275873